MKKILLTIITFAAPTFAAESPLNGTFGTQASEVSRYPLHAAICQSDIQKMEEIINAGEEVITPEGISWIHLAASWSSDLTFFQHMLALSIEGGFITNSLDFMGSTLLHSAAMNYHTSTIANYLIQEGGFTTSITCTLESHPTPVYPLFCVQQDTVASQALTKILSAGLTPEQIAEANEQKEKYKIYCLAHTEAERMNRLDLINGEFSHKDRQESLLILTEDIRRGKGTPKLNRSID